ncbi:MAG TPA: methyltransferase domain-containing protein [Gaiellaceae bacterium]|nr:methyltransferase domain-containing protein [Gaiellaceae bacterium]
MSLVRPSPSPSPSEIERYWTSHTVRTKEFESAEESAEFLEWRFGQYPLFRELTGLWGDHRGEVVLDYGCGPGNDVVGFLLHSGAAKVIGMDVSPTSIRLAGERVALHRIEPERVELVRVPEGASRLPLGDGAIDHVNCQGVLQHVTDPEHVLRELRRVLRDSGRAVVMVYNRDSVWFHLHVGYVRMVRDRVTPGASIEDVFRASTDGPDCPISRAYRPEEFLELCRSYGFDPAYAGGYFHRKELDWLRKHRAAALGSAELPEEHKAFLRALNEDDAGLPLYRGKHCGIGGVYHLRPA